MKRLLSYLFVFVSFSAYCQTQPVWYDSAMREMKYPRSVYFTGFAIGEKNPGETNEEAARRVLNEAKVEVASGIRVTVSKVMNSSSRSLLKTGSEGVSEVAMEDFSSSTTMHTEVRDIPGLVSEIWTDDKKGAIAAFAYVSKSELVRKVDRRLIANMTRLELSVEEILRLKESSRLNDALSAIDKSLLLFYDIEEDQKLLISVDDGCTDEDLQIARMNELKSTVLTVRDDLKAGVAVYIECSAELFGNDYPEFEKEIKAALSQLQCHIVSSSDNAQRAISINAYSTRQNMTELSGFRNYFSYVNADLKVEDKVKGICVYDGSVSQKGGHTRGYEEAARCGYKDIIKKVVQIFEDNLNL